MIKTEKNTVNSDRFRQVEFSDIDKFLEENENENTKKKTLSDIILFKSYLVNTGENTEIEKMTAENVQFGSLSSSEKFKHKCEQWARIFKMSHSFRIKTKSVESFTVRQSTECFR
jgi:hypothetical protein